MVLSKRERIILIGAILVVGLFVGEKIVYNPLEAKFTEMNAERADLLAELNEANTLFRAKKRLLPAWQQMLDEGFSSDTEAESRIFRALGDWSNEANLYVTSTKPDRMEADEGLKEMVFVLAGEGTLQAVAHFLWLIETSPLPLKIKQVTLGSGSDGMSLQLKLSALCLDPEWEPQESETEVES